MNLKPQVRGYARWFHMGGTIDGSQQRGTMEPLGTLRFRRNHRSTCGFRPWFRLVPQWFRMVPG